jgi:hypothetical protein
MSTAAKKETPPKLGVPANDELEFREAYAYAGEAFQLIDRYKTPPFPSTFALWYAYVSKANESLVTTVDHMLQKGSVPSPYEINELCKAHLADREAEEAQQDIGREFQQELAGVLSLIQESVNSSDKFAAALDQIEEVLPDAGAPDRVQLLLTRLMHENQRMVAQTHDLNVGLRESQKQIEKLNRELEDVRHQSMRDALSLLDQALMLDDGPLAADSVRAMLGTLDRSHAVRLLGALADGDGAALLQALGEINAQAADPAAVVDDPDLAGLEIAQRFLPRALPATCNPNGCRRPCSESFRRRTRERVCRSCGNYWSAYFREVGEGATSKSRPYPA